MESVLTALKETPIPTILVVAGIVFLLLSIAGQLAGRITVPPEQRRQATIMGYLLVVVGVALHVAPLMLNRPTRPEAPLPIAPPPTIKKDEPAQPPTTSPSTQAPPSTPEPATQDFKVVPIPSLNARLTALKFFEGNPCDMPSPERRTYKQRFPQFFAREIYIELTLEHPTRERILDFIIHAFYQREGKVIESPVLETYIPTGQQKSVYWFNRYERSKGQL